MIVVHVVAWCVLMDHEVNRWMRLNPGTYLMVIVRRAYSLNKSSMEKEGVLDKAGAA
jgi:hypothetical protein